MTPEEVAWAAGLFEGEGSIAHFQAAAPTKTRPDYKKWRRELLLGMADEDIVRRFHRIVGVGTIRKQARGKPHHSDVWIWHVTRWEDLEPLLRTLLPHFGDRRTEAALALLANPPARRHRPKEAVA